MDASTHNTAALLRTQLTGTDVHENSVQVNLTLSISLEAFAATEFNEIFSGRHQRQNVKVFRRFGD